jgi:hypothetical protein
LVDDISAGMHLPLAREVEIMIATAWTKVSVNLLAAPGVTPQYQRLES